MLGGSKSVGKCGTMGEKLSGQKIADILEDDPRLQVFQLEIC